MSSDKALEAALEAWFANTTKGWSEAMQSAISAYLSALPGEAEVVAWKVSAMDRLDQFFEIEGEADQWANSPGVFDSVVEPLVTLASLQAMQVRAEKAERERDHWKANHAEMVQRNAVLRERPDLPADRLPSIARYEARVKELEEALEPFARAADFIERDYGADTPDAQMQFPQITMRELRRARTALKGGSNG
jgi:hypothetical protein